MASAFVRPGTKKKRPIPAFVAHRQRVRTAVAAVASLTSMAIVHSAQDITSSDEKVPMHMSILSGEGWVDELSYGTSTQNDFSPDTHYHIGHPQRFRRSMGMSYPVFFRLVQVLKQKCGLAPSKHVSSEEQVAIFLRIARTGDGNREQQERFQRSGDTISK